MNRLSLMFAPLVGALALLLVSMEGRAQESICYLAAERNSTSDADLTACTRELLSGRYRGENLARTYNNRGRHYLARKEYDKALADFDQAIRINPRDKNAHNNRGVVYEARGDLDRALAAYQEAIRLDPKDVTALTGRGNLYRTKSDFDRAIADYNEAIRLAPKDALPLVGRAYTYELMRDNERAIADYKSAAALGNDYALKALRRFRKQ